MKGHCLYLSSSLSSPILPALLEACIPIRADDAVVQPRAVDKAHGVLGVCPRVVPEALCKGQLTVLFGWVQGKKNNRKILYLRSKTLPPLPSRLFYSRSSLWDPKLHSCKSKLRPGNSQKGFCTLMLVPAQTRQWNKDIKVLLRARNQ